MMSKQSGLSRVQCVLIRIKPENEQIRLEGRTNFQIDKNLFVLLISKAVGSVYALKVFGSRQSLRFDQIFKKRQKERAGWLDEGVQSEKN